jgi:hypothetical protein
MDTRSNSKRCRTDLSGIASITGSSNHFGLGSVRNSTVIPQSLEAVCLV